jgi:hypothetical protein
MTFWLWLPLTPMIGVLKDGHFSYFLRQSPRKLAKVSASPPPWKLLLPLSLKDATSHGKIGMQKRKSPRTWARPFNTWTLTNTMLHAWQKSQRHHLYKVCMDTKKYFNKYTKSDLGQVCCRPKPPPGKPSPALKSKTTEDDIPTHEGATTSFAQCFKCGSHDHLGPDCKQTKPADEWYATKAMKHYEEQTEKDKKNKDNKEQQHMTIQQTDQLADNPEPTDNVWSSISMTQFNGCQIQEQPINNNNNKYKDLIVLDSAANVDVFNNPQLVNNIKIAPSAIKVGTNNGTKSLNLTAQSRGRNSAVWFDSTAPTTNTYSLAALKKDKTVNKIVFDSSKEDAFIVHLKNGRKVKFHCTPEGLYAYGPQQQISQQSLSCSLLLEALSLPFGTFSNNTRLAEDTFEEQHHQEQPMKTAIYTRNNNSMITHNQDHFKPTTHQ